MEWRERARSFAGWFEADALFRESISLREGIPDDSKAYLTQNWIEFGRFLVTNSRPAEAVPYFAKAVPRLEALGIESSDPHRVRVIG